MVFLACKLEADLPICPLCNLSKVRRGFLVIDEVWIMMLYGKRVSNRKSDELNIWTEKDSDCRSASAQQEFSIEFLQRRPFVCLFFSGYWCGDFSVLAPLLDSLSLPPWFCLIAAPSTSTNVLKLQHTLELSGANSTEGQNRTETMIWSHSEEPVPCDM